MLFGFIILQLNVLLPQIIWESKAHCYWIEKKDLYDKAKLTVVIWVLKLLALLRALWALSSMLTLNSVFRYLKP